MTFNFADKVAVITGGSRGIGRSIAESFYKNGALVAICSRGSGEAVRTAAETGKDGRIWGEVADISDKASLTAFLQQVKEKFGRIDILVNNAGVSLSKPSMEVSEEDYDKMMDTNLKSFFFASRFAAADMLARQATGCIVNISSACAVTVLPGSAVYSASKAGVSHLTRLLAREWGKAGIRVNCVAPGSIPTAMTAAQYADIAVHRAMEEKLPLGRRGRPEEIANVVLFFASDLASYVTGQTLFVDGGLTLVHG
jgi:NAD(P)-dependent dehydrogenase (short-subunit alcohol dehydrogenase family)